MVVGFSGGVRGFAGELSRDKYPHLNGSMNGQAAGRTRRNIPGMRSVTSQAPINEAGQSNIWLHTTAGSATGLASTGFATNLRVPKVLPTSPDD